jgi:DNA-binding CsgD family transcriptional regulator
VPLSVRYLDVTHNIFIPAANSAPPDSELQMRRLLPAILPDVLPSSLSDEEKLCTLLTYTPWTRAQARVVLIGIELSTYQQIAKRIGCAEGTVHMHYSAAFARVGGGDQKSVTALAVAILWQFGGRHSSYGRAE